MADDKIDRPDGEQMALRFVLSGSVGLRLRKTTWKGN